MEPSGIPRLTARGTGGPPAILERVRNGPALFRTETAVGSKTDSEFRFEAVLEEPVHWRISHS
jgi:hypothetical protein